MKPRYRLRRPPPAEQLPPAAAIDPRTGYVLEPVVPAGGASGAPMDDASDAPGAGAAPHGDDAFLFDDDPFPTLTDVIALDAPGGGGSPADPEPRQPADAVAGTDIDDLTDILDFNLDDLDDIGGGRLDEPGDSGLPAEAAALLDRAAAELAEFDHAARAPMPAAPAMPTTPAVPPPAAATTERARPAPGGDTLRTDWDAASQRAQADLLGRLLTRSDELIDVQLRHALAAEIAGRCDELVAETRQRFDRLAGELQAALSTMVSELVVRVVEDELDRMRAAVAAPADPAASTSSATRPPSGPAPTSSR